MNIKNNKSSAQKLKQQQSPKQETTAIQPTGDTNGSGNGSGSGSGSGSGTGSGTGSGSGDGNEDYLDDDSCARLCAVVYYNSFQLCRDSDDEVIRTGLYPMGSRLNHSCWPSAFWSVDKETMRLSVRAQRTLPRDTEVSISYCDLYQPTSLRLERLFASHEFICGCTRCKDKTYKLRPIDNLLTKFVGSSDAGNAAVRECGKVLDYYRAQMDDIFKRQKEQRRRHQKQQQGEGEGGAGGEGEGKEEELGWRRKIMETVTENLQRFFPTLDGRLHPQHTYQYRLRVILANLMHSSLLPTPDYDDGFEVQYEPGEKAVLLWECAQHYILALETANAVLPPHIHDKMKIHTRLNETMQALIQEGKGKGPNQVEERGKGKASIIRETANKVQRDFKQERKLFYGL